MKLIKNNLTACYIVTKTYYTAEEERIMRFVHDKMGEVTIYQIAKAVGVTYPTAKKYVDNLIDDKIFEYADIKTSSGSEKKVVNLSKSLLSFIKEQKKQMGSVKVSNNKN
jgi:hypothetical protein